MTCSDKEVMRSSIGNGILKEVNHCNIAFNVNVDIFALLNSRATGPSRHLRVVKFSCIYKLMQFVIF